MSDFEKKNQPSLDPLLKEANDIIAKRGAIGKLWAAQVFNAVTNGDSDRETIVIQNMDRNAEKNRKNARDSWKGFQESDFRHLLLDRNTLSKAKEKFGGSQSKDWEQSVDDILTEINKSIEKEAHAIIEPFGSFNENGFESKPPAHTEEEYLETLQRRAKRTNTSMEDIATDRKHVESVINQIRHYEALLKTANIALANDGSKKEEHAALQQYMQHYKVFTETASALADSILQKLNQESARLKEREQAEGAKRAEDAIDQM